MHNCCTFPGHSGPTCMFFFGEQGGGGGGGGGSLLCTLRAFNTSPVN